MTFPTWSPSDYDAFNRTFADELRANVPLLAEQTDEQLKSIAGLALKCASATDVHAPRDGADAVCGFTIGGKPVV